MERTSSSGDISLGQVLDQAEIEYGLKGAHNGKQANFIINARGFQRADGTFSGPINLMNIDARNSRGISQRLFKAPGLCYEQNG